jgi:hypothetical protein
MGCKRNARSVSHHPWSRDADQVPLSARWLCGVALERMPGAVDREGVEESPGLGRNRGQLGDGGSPVGRVTHVASLHPDLAGLASLVIHSVPTFGGILPVSAERLGHSRRHRAAC